MMIHVFASATSRRRQAPGVALVVVLACLVLISGLLVAFLTSVRTDLGASSSYASGINSRLVADSALNLVIGQIQKATASAGETWISQPGLIRTYTADGTPATTYKLYSSDEIEIAGAFDPAGDLPPTGADGWEKQPNLYTDLNTPLASGATTIYPIIDASGITSAGIIDPDGDGAPDVEGFKVTDAAFLGTNANGTRQLPMPVKWLYQLKDGSLANAVSGPGTAVILKNLDGSPVTAANPPVARLAFWTDDESSKVNINTASEGTYWDTPVANSWPSAAGNDTDQFNYTPDPNSVFELDLAYFQGAQREYQRYPGHPATTSLLPVLSSAISKVIDPSGTKDYATLRPELAEAIYKIVPRVKGAEPDGADYSSRSGTARAASILSPDTDRLYASVDELFFRVDRDAESTFGSRQAAMATLEQSKFFLTASSRAPEVNLFGGPRVASWPIHLDPARRTAFDKMIAFCATLNPAGGGQPYYFTRSNSLSMTEDFTARNLALYDYLEARMGRPVPGFGGTFAAKYQQDAPQILTEMVDYIRSCLNLYDVSEPGVHYTVDEFTDSGQGGYPVSPPKERTVRGFVVPLKHPTNGTRGLGRFPTISELVLSLVRTRNPGGETNPVDYYKDGPVAPTDPKWREKSKTETYMQVALLPEMFYPAAGFTVPYHNFRIEVSGLNTITVASSEAPGEPKSGFFPSDTHTFYAIAQTSQSTDAATVYKAGQTNEGEYRYDNRTGGTIPLSVLYSRFLEKEDMPYSLPAVGSVVLKGATSDVTCTVSSGDLILRVIAPHDAPDDVDHEIQRLVVSFPETVVCMPNPFVKGMNGSELNANNEDAFLGPDGNPYRVDSNGKRRSFRVAIRDVFRGEIGGINQPGMPRHVLDSVRSLVPTAQANADYRLLAGTHDISAFFEPHADNDRIEADGRPTGLAHSVKGGVIGPDSDYQGSLREEEPTSRWVPRFGSLLPSIPASAYESWSRADIPPGVNALNADDLPGDWDNGVGLMPDGAYINKADEGSEMKRKNAPYIGYKWTGQSTELIPVSHFSPNRQMPSPVMFGSLPTGVKRVKPWQTLLFRPAKAYLPGGTNHPGSSATGPADHLLLDLFWMPVVEPYAISEPFSTAGKINLNYQIAPFTYIERKTGMHAVLKSAKITAIPQTAVAKYKSTAEGTTRPAAMRDVSFRHNIDVEPTLAFFDERFSNNRPFISASEICEIPLVPESAGASGETDVTAIDAKLATFWSAHKLTGDNSLERPYAHIYPRVTTKSNTFSVHVYVQALRKTPALPADQFDEARDAVTGEFRGSFIIERYLDPAKDSFDESNANAVLGPYKCRVISSKQLSL